LQAVAGILECVGEVGGGPGMSFKTLKFDLSFVDGEIQDRRNIRNRLCGTQYHPVKKYASVLLMCVTGYKASLMGACVSTA
jgi:hypothetical protein